MLGSLHYDTPTVGILDHHCSAVEVSQELLVGAHLVLDTLELTVLHLHCLEDLVRFRDLGKELTEAYW